MIMRFHGRPGYRPAPVQALYTILLRLVIAGTLTVAITGCPLNKIWERSRVSEGAACRAFGTAAAMFWTSSIVTVGYRPSG